MFLVLASSTTECSLQHSITDVYIHLYPPSNTVYNKHFTLGIKVIQRCNSNFTNQTITTIIKPNYHFLKLCVALHR